jgi:mono/diheme cytochrome c family protein
MSKPNPNERTVHPWAWFTGGAAAVIAITALCAYGALATGLVPANADAQPSALERWAARLSLHATVSREAATLADPLVPDDATLHAGLKLYGSNCMVCHGAADGKPSNVAMGLYQNAPQLGRHGVEDDPEGETYWKVAHGIRLTGMPSFDKTLTQTQLWQLATFLKHMDSLPPRVSAEWKKTPSQAAPGSRPSGPHPQGQ